MKQVGKKSLALLVALVFIISLLPLSVFAANYGPADQTPANGEEYLVVAKSGNNYFALKNNNGQVAAVPATVSGTTATISDAEDANCTWTAEASGTGFRLKNNGLYLGSNGYDSLNLKASHSYPEINIWVQNGAKLHTNGNTYYLTISGSNFAMGYGGYSPTGMSDISFYKVQAAPTPTVDSVTVTPATASINVGATTTLSATVNGSEGVSQDVTWSTANPAFATVDNDGVVTGVGAGTVAITATSVEDETKFATCVVTVTAATVPVTGVTLDQHSLTLTAGGATATLTAAVAPADATDKSLTWVSSDTNVATVADGVVTPVGEGTASIGVASVDNPGANDICAVTVEAAPVPEGKTYELVSAIEDGKNYLIVSSNAASSAFALKNDNGVAREAVEIADGKIIASDDSIVWKVSGSANNFTLENGSGAFLQRSSSNTLTIGGSATNWNWQYSVPMNGDRAVTYNNGFTLTYVPYEAAIANNKVYFFEETGEPAPATEYSITIAATENGTVTADKETAEAGETVTLTVTPAEGYELDTLTVKNGDEDVQVENNAFTMPAGDVTVTATFSETVTVTGVTVTPDTATVNVGETVQLSATVSGSAGVSQAVNWSTANPAFATVGDDGVVTGVGAGTVAITATSVADETKFATCIVTVEAAPAPAGKTYKLVTDIQDGNYLIVSTNGDGDASALTLNGNAFGKEAVTIANGEITYEGTAAVWAVSGTSSSFELSNGGARIGAGPGYAPDQLAIEPTSLVNPVWNWSMNNTRGAQCGSYNRAICWNGSNFIFGDTAAGGNSRIYFFEETEAVPEFAGHQIFLTDQLNMRFYLDLSTLTAEEIADSRISYRIGTTGGGEAEVTATSEEGKYYFECEVNSLQMADTIAVTFSYGDGKFIDDVYSVEDYLEHVIDNPDYQQPLWDLAKAIGDYGHYAQAYLAEAHGFVIGEDYAFMQAYNASLDIAEARSGLANYAPAFSKDPGCAVDKLQIRLSLENTITMGIRAHAPAGTVINGGISGADYTEVFDENGIAAVEGIKISQLGMGGVIAASASDGGDPVQFTGLVYPLSYSYLVVNSNTASDANQNLAAALYFLFTAAIGSIN